MAPPWTPIIQSIVSAGAAAVAFAVYRVQADKLFLEMREKRLATLDAFREVMRSRNLLYLSITRNNVDEVVGGDAFAQNMSRYWEAERELSLWFGNEVSAAATVADKALSAFVQALISWASMDKHDPDAFEASNKSYFAADKAFSSVIDRARPYVAAGRRGLPLRKSISFWRVLPKRRSSKG
jgi:hypothetical protein